MNIIDLLISVGLGLLLIAAYAALYFLRQHMQGTQLAGIIRIFVGDAEQRKVGGANKLAWVFDQVDRRFPNADRELIRSMVEAEVLRLNQALDASASRQKQASAQADEAPEWRRVASNNVTDRSIS